MKAGDKLICKKRIDNIRLGDKVLVNIVSYSTIHLEGNGFRFVLALDSKHRWYIWNYFYTEQEVRRLKLERLNKKL